MQVCQLMASKKKKKSIRPWINSNGNSSHCSTGLEGKVNAFLLHNQSLLMARQRSLRMQTLAAPASYNIWHQSSNFVISLRSNNFLCGTARQCVFPKPPGSQVLHVGERSPLKEPAEAQAARAERQGPLSHRPPATAAVTPSRSGLLKTPAAKLNNDYEVLNTAVMKVTGPRSSFSWTKTYFTAAQAVTPVGKASWDWLWTRAVRHGSTFSRSECGWDLRHQLKIRHLVSLCRRTTLSIALAK